MSILRRDQVMMWILRACAALAGLILLLIIFFLLREAAPVLTNISITRFFTDASWHPTENKYNLTPMIWGTLYVTFGAVLLAVPAGVLSAMFCHYYAPVSLARLYHRLIELLAGIPSVVYGLWGLVSIVPLIAQLQPPGSSLLAGIIILSLMILPTIALVAYASFANVPKHYLTSAVALGLSRWTTITQVVIPIAKSGLITGIVLATARALGETMAVLMVSGNVINTPNSIFDPIRTLTANIALEMGYAMDDHRAALFVSGLVLMSMVVALITLATRIDKGHVRV